MTEQMIDQKIYWTKDAFSMNYSIYLDGNVVGIIQDKSTLRSVKASIFGKKFVFESDGFLKPKILIIDLEKKKEIGKIDFTVFKATANIHIGKKDFKWKFDNIMCTRWSLRDADGNVIVSSKSRNEGYCLLEDEDTAFLLLVALTMRNHFTKQGY